MSLVGLYAWPLLAAGFFATAMALLGAQLAARDRVVESLCLSQGAALGVMLAMGISHLSPKLSHERLSWFPWVLSLVFTGLTFGGARGLSRGYRVSKNSFLLSLFCVLMSLTYFSDAWFPAVENHVNQVFFGDLATLGDRESQVALVVAGLSLMVLGWGRKRFANASFELMILPTLQSSRGRWSVGFDLLTLVLISFSSHFMGLLFTLVTLFIPTTLLSKSTRSFRGSRLQRHFMAIAVTAFLAADLGFLVSLQMPWVPTVPMICLMTAVLGGLAAL